MKKLLIVIGLVIGGCSCVPTPYTTCLDRCNAELESDDFIMKCVNECVTNSAERCKIMEKYKSNQFVTPNKNE